MTQTPMQTDVPTGVPTGGKPINLVQLQNEVVAAGVSVSEGLGMADDLQVIFTYAGGTPADFASADVPTVQTAITNHVALRDKTDDEYATEFAAPGTTADRQREINAILNGLLPREQVPM